MSGALQAVFQNQRSFGPPPGSCSYVTPGTYSWVAPAGVTKISIVVVGAGGNGSNCGGGGGGGGGLAYRNNVTVTPGCSYAVVVGNSIAGSACTFAGTSSFNGTAPAATGGNNGRAGANCYAGGTPSGTRTGGANGGAGSNQGNGGGGGAAGYSGNGGAAGRSGTTCGKAGSGGGGGGGTQGVFYSEGGVCRRGGGSGGGGVGILGEGTSGASVNQNASFYPQPAGRGGSGGANGGVGCANSQSGVGGAYGGGGGGGSSPRGGFGAVRIVWPGCARSFPSTCVGSP
jgi:hypothetical protein